jgi:hypothetical protein
MNWDKWADSAGTVSRSFYDEMDLIQQRLHTYLFMEITTLGCWNIWLGNGKVFNNERPLINNRKRKLKEDMSLVIHRAKQNKSQVIQD